MKILRKLFKYKWLFLALFATYTVAYFSYVAYVKHNSDKVYDSYLAANEFTANKIKANVETQNEEIKRVLKLFATSNSDLIKALFEDPENEVFIEKVSDKLQIFVGDFFTFTLVNENGEPLLENFEGLIGEACLADIKLYSESGKDNVSFHRNPFAYHVDYMANLENIGIEGLLFVSFLPEKISSLLKHIDQKEQEALLMNKQRPFLVDFDVNTRSSNPVYKRFITAEDLNTSVVFVAVEGTNWTLFVKTNNDVLNAAITKIDNNAKKIVFLILFLLSVIYFVINKQVFLKLDSEIKLRKHYQNYYFESSVITLVICADSSKIYEVNKAAVEFYGFDETELKNKKFQDLSSKSKSKNKFDINELNENNIKYFTCQHILKNKYKVQLEVHFSFFQEDNNNYFLLLIHELDDKIYFQQQLQNKTTLLESIALALPDMTSVIDKDGVYLDVLEGGQFSKEQVNEIIGINITDIFDKDLSKLFLRVINQVLVTNEAQIIEYQTDIITEGMCWYEGRVVPMSSSKDYVNSVLWLTRNIEDKKIKEQELTLAAMLFNTSDPVVIGNKHGKIITVNPSFVNVLGYSEEELIGKNIGVFKSDKEKAVDVFKEINSGLNKSGQWSGVTLNVCANGTQLSMLETVTTIYDHNNNVDKVIAQFKDISEMLTLKLLVDQSEARFKAIVETTNDIVIVTTKNGITYVSPSSEKLSGYTKEEILKMDMSALIHKKDVESVLNCFSVCLQKENNIVEIAPFRALAKNKKWYWVKGSLSNLKHVKGINGLVLSLENVTEIIKVETAFKKEVRKFKAIIENGRDLVVVFNKNRQITYISPSVGKCLDYKNDYMVGMLISKELMHEEDLALLKGKFGYLLMHPNEELILPDIRIKHNDGHYIVLEGVVTSIIEKNSVDAIVFNARDVTSKRKDEQKIEYQAFYDSLTNLPNRQFLTKYLSKVPSTEKRQHPIGVVAFLDLDHFKYVNDSLGHDIGDKLLQQVVRRITPLIRTGDLFSRLGGDEFVIVLQNLGENEAEVIKKTDQFCNKLLKIMAKKFIVDSHELYITPSIGLKLFSSNNYEGVNELLKHADGAMYHAKGLGRNQFVYYDEAIQEKSVLRLYIENDLREAVKQKQLVLHYQPQYSKDGVIIGAEALIRWQHPKKGLLYPIDFISVAEETGLIIEMGQWVIANALFNLQTCLDKNLIDESFVMSINISTKQFLAKGFVGNFVSQLNAYPKLKNMLKVEVTETLLLDNLAMAKDKMLQLIEHGVQFSLDDFGTGYSSLQYLTRLPIKQLKIDRSFVSNIGKDSRDAAMVEMIISMATLLNLSVVAEGVESKEQLDFLNQHGDVIIQGYYYSRPLEIDKLYLELEKNDF